MNVREMQIEFERRVQITSPDLLVDNKLKSSDTLAFLNAGQNRYVKLVFNQKDEIIDSTRSHKRNADSIKSLLVQKKLTTATYTASGHSRFELPSVANEEYFLYVSSTSNISGTYLNLTSPYEIENRMIDPEQLVKYTKTFDNDPIITIPGILLMSDQQTKLNYAVVAVDSHTIINSLLLNYYRKPLKMALRTSTNVVTTCELPDSTHNEIIDLAVEMFINETKYRLAQRPNNQQS